MALAHCVAACRDGEVEFLRDVFKRARQTSGPAGLPALLSETDGEGNSLLHISAAAGKGAVVDLLLAFGAAVNRNNPLGATPLHAACSSPPSETSLSLVNTLLDARAQPNIQDAGGETPLHTLLRTAKEARYHALLEQVAGTSTHPELDVSREELEKLLSRGQQATLTHYYDDLVDALIDRGGDVLTTNAKGEMATDLCLDGFLVGRLVRRYRLDYSKAATQAEWQLQVGLKSTTVSPSAGPRPTDASGE